MNGVQGPYARRVFVEELGAPEFPGKDTAEGVIGRSGSPSFALPRSVLMNAVPKEDFGGKNSPSHGHADPNLTYAVELVQKMGTNKTGADQRVLKKRTNENPVVYIYIYIYLCVCCLKGHL